MANFNELCICIKFCLKLRKTPSDMWETKSVFTVMTQQANNSPVSGKNHCYPCPKKMRWVRSNTRIMLVNFFNWGHCSSEICSPMLCG